MQRRCSFHPRMGAWHLYFLHEIKKGAGESMQYDRDSFLGQHCPWLIYSFPGFKILEHVTGP